MAIVKCMNPECDYFERAVPEGDCCPYCGYELNSGAIGSESSPSYYTAPDPEPIPVSPPPSYDNVPSRTVVEVPSTNLRLVHSNSGETFTISRDSAMNKIYLGRQDGLPSDRNVIDISGIPFSERVSRLHAYVTWDSYRNGFTIVDDNSTNGTILNSQPLTPQEPYPLNTGDRLEFGREHKVIFQVEIG